MWRLWAKALGEKASKCDREANTVALNGEGPVGRGICLENSRV